MVYPPAVEKWRPLIEKYFRPEDVDKALYVINGESGGNPKANGDSGSSIGLFQMNMAGGLGTGSNQAQLEDPEYNIKLAAQAVYGGSGWGPWGEGTSYQGKKFGALGNNPYPGPNARVPVGGAVKPKQTEQSSGFINDPRKLPTMAQLLNSKKSSGKTYAGIQPTGDYDTDSSAYWAAAEEAYAELAKYQNDSDAIIVPDEEEGIVYRYDEETESLIPDEEGTKILQRALINTQSLDRLYAGKKAGLVATGEGSAAAFVAAEKEKNVDAASDYEDYVKRVSDLAAVEDIPMARAANFANTIATINKAARESGRTYAGGMQSSGRPQGTNFQPFADSMRGAIPSEAPAPYDIPSSVFDMTKINPNRIPARDPNQILADIGVEPPPSYTSVPAGTGTAPLTTLPSAAAPPLTTLGNKIRQSTYTGTTMPPIPDLQSVISASRFRR